MFKQPMTVVRHLACFPVHGVRYMHQFCTEVHAQRLVAEAYTQYRRMFMKLVYYLHGNSCL